LSIALKDGSRPPLEPPRHYIALMIKEVRQEEVTGQSAVRLANRG